MQYTAWLKRKQQSLILHLFSQLLTYSYALIKKIEKDTQREGEWLPITVLEMNICFQSEVCNLFAKSEGDNFVKEEDTMCLYEC